MIGDAGAASAAQSVMLILSGAAFVALDTCASLLRVTVLLLELVVTESISHVLVCRSACAQVRIFIKFDRAEASTRALVDLQGRFFGGRQVRLCSTTGPNMCQTCFFF
jgi:hypothetical protein